MILIRIILLIFVLLILSHVFNSLFKVKVIEGAAKYTDPGLQNDPLYIATTNAANITYLKSQIDNIQSLKAQIYDMSGQVQMNASAIVGLNQAMSQASTDVTGGP